MSLAEDVAESPGRKFSSKKPIFDPILDGVSVSWLMRVFGLSRYKIETKLRGVKPVGEGKHNVPLYDIAEAAECLVKPKLDIQTYLKDLKPEHLPEHLREPYWNARLKQQRFEENAGDLWRTDLVLDRISELLQEVRTKLQLLPDRIEGAVGLRVDQTKRVTEIVDVLQGEIYEYVLDMAKQRRTPSQLGEDRRKDEDELI